MSVNYMAVTYAREEARRLKMTAIQASVFKELASFLSLTTGQCYPKIETLCQYTRLSHRSVTRALEELVEQGVVTRETVFKGGRQRANMYRLPKYAEMLEEIESETGSEVKNADLIAKLKKQYGL